MAGADEDDPLVHMRQRIEMCRRLAKNIGDEEARMALLGMAEQGEKDLEKLEAERAGRRSTT